MNKNILLIGAGNIGSRHLQGLKKVRFPLTIEVVDPSLDSLKIAEERYQQIISSVSHKVNFATDVSRQLKSFDLAIIATNSNVRRKVTEELLENFDVKHIIFEKLLFQKKEDYLAIEKLLKKKGVKSCVNCSMRVTPFYTNLKNKIRGGVVNLVVSGSKYGFITNSIHFIDYLAYLTDCYDFKLDTSFLDKKPIESKREGFLEFNGTLNAYFTNGSMGTFVCFKEGYAPVTVEIIVNNFRAMADETSRNAWISGPPNWQWEKTNEILPFQSELTNTVVEEILEKGQCKLTNFSKSSKLHLQLLEALKSHLNKNSSKKYNYYPFT